MKLLYTQSTQTGLQAVKSTRSGSFIFHGADGSGKRLAAIELARELNCRGDDKAPCASCRQFAASNYPDLCMLKSEGRASITIEQVRELMKTTALGLYYSAGVRVVIIDEADKLTREAQNALLKLIEEPPAQTLFILVSERPEVLLPTVRSRCAHVYFGPLPSSQIAELLVSQFGVKHSDADTIARTSGGAPGIAIRLASDADAVNARVELLRLVESIKHQSTFDRLVMASKLVEAKADLAAFGDLLHYNLVQSLRHRECGPQETAKSLAALEKFRERLSGSVTPKVAFESLMLEIY